MKNIGRALALGLGLCLSSGCAGHIKKKYDLEKHLKQQAIQDERVVIPPIEDLMINFRKYEPIKNKYFSLLMSSASNTNNFANNQGLEIIIESYKTHFAKIVNYRFYTNNLSEVHAGIDSWGSGFFISPDGFLLTSNHVIDNEANIQTFAISFDLENKLRWSKLDVLAFSKKRDISLCKAENKFYEEIKPIPIMEKPLQRNGYIIGVHFDYQEKFGNVTFINPKIYPLELFYNQDNSEISLGLSQDYSSIKPCFEPWIGLSGGTYILAEGRLYQWENRSYFKGNIPSSYRTGGVGKVDFGDSGSMIFGKNGNLGGVLTGSKTNSKDIVLSGPETLRNFLEQYQSHVSNMSSSR